MGWAILILLLLFARGKPAATAATASVPATAVNPATGRVLPAASNPNLSVAGLTQVTPDVFMPDQVRDTTSKKIHAVASLGPSIAQQSQTIFNSSFSANPDLAGSFLGAFNASFDLNNPASQGGPVDSGAGAGTGAFHEDFV